MLFYRSLIITLSHYNATSIVISSSPNSSSQIPHHRAIPSHPIQTGLPDVLLTAPCNTKTHIPLQPLASPSHTRPTTTSLLLHKHLVKPISKTTTSQRTLSSHPIIKRHHLLNLSHSQLIYTSLKILSLDILPTTHSISICLPWTKSYQHGISTKKYARAS